MPQTSQTLKSPAGTHLISIVQLKIFNLGRNYPADVGQSMGSSMPSRSSCEDQEGIETSHELVAYGWVETVRQAKSALACRFRTP